MLAVSSMYRSACNNSWPTSCGMTTEWLGASWWSQWVAWKAPNRGDRVAHSVKSLIDGDRFCFRYGVLRVLVDDFLVDGLTRYEGVTTICEGCMY